jgi:hypothetical protein
LSGVPTADCRLFKRMSLALLAVAFTAAPAAAFEVHVREVKAAASTLRARIELRDLVPDRFRRLLQDNGTLYLRIQAEVWESRPVWDRLVYPALIRVVRMTPASVGNASAMPLDLELGKTDRIVDSARYYVNVVATVGTLAERDVEDAGDAVFGRESEANSLGSLGRLVFRTALQISDYLQSVSAQARTKRISGSELLRP